MDEIKCAICANSLDAGDVLAASDMEFVAMECSCTFHKWCFDSYQASAGVARVLLTCPCCRTNALTVRGLEDRPAVELVVEDGDVEVDTASTATIDTLRSDPEDDLDVPPPPAEEGAVEATVEAAPGATVEAAPGAAAVEAAPGAAEGAVEAAPEPVEGAAVEAAPGGAAVEAAPEPVEGAAPVAAPSAPPAVPPAVRNCKGTASMFGKAFEDRYICDFCGSSCAAERVRIQSKKKQTYKCDICNCKMTQLNTIFGSWPSASYREMAKDAQREFMHGLHECGSMDDVRTQANHTLSSYEEHARFYDDAGEYLPLSVWTQKGFDAADIAAKTAASNQKLHSVLGMTYRVGIVSSGSRGSQGQKRSWDAIAEDVSAAQTPAPGSHPATSAASGSAEPAPAVKKESTSSSSSSSSLKKKKKKKHPKSKKAKKEKAKEAAIVNREKEAAKARTQKQKQASAIVKKLDAQLMSMRITLSNPLTGHLPQVTKDAVLVKVDGIDSILKKAQLVQQDPVAHNLPAESHKEIAELLISAKKGIAAVVGMMGHIQRLAT